MENFVYTKTYKPMSVNLREVMRYAGIGGNAPELDALIDECLAEAEGVFSYKVCYAVLPCRVSQSEVDFGRFSVTSQDLAKNLKNAQRAVIFAAGVGMGIDRLIKKYSVIAPSKSVIFQAIGAERAESLCDAFNRDIDIEFKNTSPRFSPGYGDFPLSTQREIFALLDCPRNVGISLGENLLMSPSKSVTAVIGILQPEGESI